MFISIYWFIHSNWLTDLGGRYDNSYGGNQRQYNDQNRGRPGHRGGMFIFFFFFFLFIFIFILFKKEIVGEPIEDIIIIIIIIMQMVIKNLLNINEVIQQQHLNNNNNNNNSIFNIFISFSPVEWRILRDGFLLVLLCYLVRKADVYPMMMMMLCFCFLFYLFFSFSSFFFGFVCNDQVLHDYKKKNKFNNCALSFFSNKSNK